MDRRKFLAALPVALSSGALAHTMPAKTPALPRLHKPDYSLTIAPGVLDIDNDTTVSTRLYNGRFPGPLLRLTEGKRVEIDVRNDTDIPEQLHWHGQFVGVDVDGAAEEGTPFIAPHSTRRIAFEPRPSGFRFYHTHVTAGLDLSLGFYSGLAGPVYIEPRQNAGRYDQEVFLTLKEFGPYLNHIEMFGAFLLHKKADYFLQEIDRASVAEAKRRRKEPVGYELAYQHYTINGKSLGAGPPIKVKPGDRVLFHVLNASATEIRSLALPGHAFRVIALDGNPVPRQTSVPVLWLGPGERICAIVEMKTPGVWILGDTDHMSRTGGMGVVVEYAKQTGTPQWKDPPGFFWDYSLFADPKAKARPPDRTIELTFATRYVARDGFNVFTVNGKAFSMQTMQPRFKLQYGRRYRLKLRNATDDIHPLHLHRHVFEITSIAGVPTAGVMKDVAMIGGFQEMTVDFDANQKGLSLFHCHMQSHMDMGFMALFDCG